MLFLLACAKATATDSPFPTAMTKEEVYALCLWDMKLNDIWRETRRMPADLSFWQQRLLKTGKPGFKYAPKHLVEALLEADQGKRIPDRLAIADFQVVFPREKPYTFHKTTHGWDLDVLHEINEI